MTTSYLKEKSTGKILASTGGQDSNNPIHVEAMNNFVTSRGWSLDDYEIGFTDDNVVAEWIKAQDEASKTYSDKRKESYPPATDYLDGVVKGDQVQIDKYIADCLAVKDKYPK